MLEAVAATPQAARAPQHLLERLASERLPLAKELHRSANELGRRRSFARGCVVEPGLVLFLQRYHGALHDIMMPLHARDVNAPPPRGWPARRGHAKSDRVDQLPSTVSIRQAEPADLQAVTRLLAQADAEHAARIPAFFVATDPAAPRADDAVPRRLRGEGGVTLVACLPAGGGEGQEEVAGVIEIDRVERPARPGQPAQRYAMVQALVVADTRRGQGLAARLMEAGRAWADEQGLTPLRLHVWDANLPARRLYRRLGFTTLGRVLRQDGLPVPQPSPPVTCFAGRCLCGGVRFRAEGPSLFCCHCHCNWCRAAHGAAFVTWLGVREEAFHAEDPEGLLRWFASSPTARRAFCGRCGSTMLYASELSPGEVHIARALIDGPVDRLPKVHLFSDHAVEWMPIEDDLPRVPSDHPGLTKYATVRAPPR